MPDAIDELLEEILVDAYGDSEQLTSFEIAFEGRARFPFRARIVGTTVDVTKVRYEGDERRGLTAVCRHEGETLRVALADHTPGVMTHETARLLAAYRRWLGVPPLAPSEPPQAPEPWVYRPVATRRIELNRPLKLRPTGTWDPADQYWGEDGLEVHPLYAPIIAAGPRPEFEMEQVIPGIEADDWDLDPVADAAELHGAGYGREAGRILRDLIEKDERCVDAWAHLGSIALAAKGPKAALELYDTAVGIAEQSLPPGFDGVLPRGLVDNRPFHRALHGLGLCAWRQRRWSDAEVIFTNLLWIDGARTWTALECVLSVRRHERWRRD